MLKHYCDGIVDNQTREIDEMREQLCKKFSLCDFQPGSGRNGQHANGAVGRQ